MTGPLLTLSGLRVTYPSRHGPVAAVDGVSLTVERGEVLGLVGASGCGKSTVVAALAGLLPPSAASTVDRFTLGELDLSAATTGTWQAVRGRRIGLVPQQPMTALTPTVAIGKQLDWYLGTGAVARYEGALRDLGLDPVVDRSDDLPSRFSGGQLQRLLIAVNTLGGHPELLLADEPTSTLDASVQAVILDHLAALHDDHDMATVLVSHDLAVVARLADRVGVMHGGTIVESAAVDELFGAPVHPVTQALVRATASGSTTRRPDPVPQVQTDSDVPVVLEVDRLYHYYGRPSAERAGRGGHPGRPGRGVVRAVDDVSLTVHQGEVVAIVGASGSGKSTLARAVVGAVQATAGAIRLDGRELTADRSLEDRRRIQLVTQNPRAALNRRRRVGHALDQAQRVHGLGTDAADRRRASVRLLDLVHLPEAALDRRPTELSGGELARVVLARALLLEPRLLLLDESTSSLDAPVKAAVLALLAELTDRLDLATVVITHELGTARVVADRVVVMERGRVVESGPTDDVLSRPVERYTRELVASEPRPIASLPSS